MGLSVQWARFFEVVVEPAAPRLAMIVIAHNVRFDHREFVVSHAVSKYVLDSFDRLLSANLSARHGEGLPQAAVDTRIQDQATKREWAPFPRRYCESPAAAIALAAKLALGSAPRVSALVGTCGSRDLVLDARQEITPKTVSALEQALDVCGRIGCPDFLEASADFSWLVVRPRETKVRPASIDLQHGTIWIPATDPGGAPACEPLSGFAEAMLGKPAVASWMAEARQATAQLREDAIRSFLDSADQRVFQLSAAIDRRALKGYRMEVVAGFVTRLQAGLGLSLAGLNGAAQITALDWASSLRGDTEARLTDTAVTQRRLGMDHADAVPHFMERQRGTG